MKPLQRYEIDEHGCDYPYSEGDWVRDEDVKKLEELNKEMLKALKIMTAIADRYESEFDEFIYFDNIVFAQSVINRVEGENQ